MTHIAEIIPQVLLDVALRQVVAHIDHDDARQFDLFSEAELSVSAVNDNERS